MPSTIWSSVDVVWKIRNNSQIENLDRYGENEIDQREAIKIVLRHVLSASGFVWLAKSQSVGLWERSAAAARKKEKTA